VVLRYHIPSKSIDPVLSRSTSLIMSCSSVSDGSRPSERIISPSSSLVISPTILNPGQRNPASKNVVMTTTLCLASIFPLSFPVLEGGQGGGGAAGGAESGVAEVVRLTIAVFVLGGSSLLFAPARVVGGGHTKAAKACLYSLICSSVNASVCSRKNFVVSTSLVSASGCSLETHEAVRLAGHTIVLRNLRAMGEGFW
jgi:hypothetical protein